MYTAPTASIAPVKPNTWQEEGYAYCERWFGAHGGRVLGLCIVAVLFLCSGLWWILTSPFIWAGKLVLWLCLGTIKIVCLSWVKVAAIGGASMAFIAGTLSEGYRSTKFFCTLAGVLLLGRYAFQFCAFYMLPMLPVSHLLLIS